MNKTSRLKVHIIIGSTRKNRFGDKPAKWIFDLAKKRDDLEVELIDLRDYPLPFFDEKMGPLGLKGKYETKGAKEWAAKVGEADAFIIVAPEYNHGTSAVLKNALDYVYSEWNKKPVAFVSYGGVGGARAVEQLRLVSIELQMAPINRAVHITDFWSLLDDKGQLKPKALDDWKENAEGMLNDLVWWGNALKSARG